MNIIVKQNVPKTIIYPAIMISKQNSLFLMNKDDDKTVILLKPGENSTFTNDQIGLPKDANFLELKPFDGTITLSNNII